MAFIGWPPFDMWKLSEKENFLSELKIKDIKIQQAGNKGKFSH